VHGHPRGLSWDDGVDARPASPHHESVLMELERLRVAEGTCQSVNLSMFVRRDGGTGSVQLNQLKAEPSQLGVQRIDTSIHLKKQASASIP
jgi:hypothetical protein